MHFRDAQHSISAVKSSDINASRTPSNAHTQQVCVDFDWSDLFSLPAHTTFSDHTNYSDHTGSQNKLLRLFSLYYIN